jgi:hypothetical protein
LKRAAGALQGYRGDDRIIAHLRDLVLLAMKGRGRPRALGEVTPAALEAREALTPLLDAVPRAGPGWPAMLAVIGGLLLVIAVLAFLFVR